jgi:hypothetical protein
LQGDPPQIGKRARQVQEHLDIAINFPSAISVHQFFVTSSSFNTEESSVSALPGIGCLETTALPESFAALNPERSLAVQIKELQNGLEPGGFAFCSNRERRMRSPKTPAAAAPERTGEWCLLTGRRKLISVFR